VSPKIFTTLELSGYCKKTVVKAKNIQAMSILFIWISVFIYVYKNAYRGKYKMCACYKAKETQSNINMNSNFWPKKMQLI
jgi:hypothetical protein